MKRREILKYTAYMTGAAISLPLATTILSGCKVDAEVNAKEFKLNFFTKEEFANLKGLIDTILPKTDSPAASEVGVHRMIDSMVITYDAEKLSEYRSGYDSFISYLKSKAGEENFIDLPELKKIEILKALDTSTDNKEAKSAYLELKQQTIAYYLSTEEIAINYLNYLPVPGDYIGCIPLSEVNGKAWAL